MSNPHLSSLNLVPSSFNPDQALAALLAGNQRFVEQQQNHPHQDFNRLSSVAEHQAPFAAILSCADSRVIPEILFDQGIGDLFVIRVAGNIAAIEDIASVEYAVFVLQVSLVVILGHERCGAVQATLAGNPLPGAMHTLVNAIQPAVERSAQEEGDRLANAVKANVQLQGQRLCSSPVIKDAIAKGALRIIGAYYDLDTALIETMEICPVPVVTI
ncbi:carbonic anhydrase [Candidatus Synechococcus calcipolaris G9]|uniref:Carbonic anhydrase n=1 Tax=Candidatus Synechococcus calcipolaris G9 TaxID=1497997 RepID=A0ABT6F113_9SYNE|nr:carbonic anhydrase [Candidatus Synechococcus calcipolaris]MDG2991517.1 carbonic anhydrase [Candidatus Synechococcus calcipolaris G9]